MALADAPIVRHRSWRVAGSAVAGSIAIHWLLLAWFAAESPVRVKMEPSPGAGALQVRIAASDVVQSAAIRLPGSADVEPVGSEPPPADSRPAPTPAAAETGLALPSDVVPLPQPSADAHLGATAVGGYHPRRVLTRAPQPLTDPSVSLPPGMGAAGEQRGVFSLFINAEGDVDAVVPDGPTLAPVLEEEARRVLAAVRFRPGEIDGRAVATLIRIEMVFENATSADASAPVIVSRQPL